MDVYFIIKETLLVNHNDISGGFFIKFSFLLGISTHTQTGTHVVNTQELVVLGKDLFMSWPAMSKAASTQTSLGMTS